MLVLATTAHSRNMACVVNDESRNVFLASFHRDVSRYEFEFVSVVLVVFVVVVVADTNR